MKLKEITDGLKKLLEENHYSPETIRVYEREWNRIRLFLINTYGNTEFDMEKGLLYLERQHGILTDHQNGKLTQNQVQLIRVVHILEDYRLHHVLTRRVCASLNPIILTIYLDLHNSYSAYLGKSDLSKCTIEHYTKISLSFLDYLEQLDINPISNLSMENCNDYIKTLAGYTFKTVEQYVCGIRHFLRFLFTNKTITVNFADKIHMPKISKIAKIPSTWSHEELTKLLSAIDRNSPIGKRDYAMILLALVLGLRIGDIKNLKFSNFDWENKQLSIVQHKTHKSLTLPLPDAIGWAIIDYIKNGRPSFYDTDIIFIKHMPPFDPFPDNDHLEQVIKKYSNKAGINRRKMHSGFHSLRHSAASMYLEMETPLNIITEILGHSDSDITSVYLKTDLAKLKDCVLDFGGSEDE